MARKYTSIWLELKAKKKCAIAAPKPLHARIIKAVIGEKYRDLGYKVVKMAERKRIILDYVVDGARIRFFLREYDMLTGISIGELEDMCGATVKEL